jgi:hypothetical protein
MIFEEIKKYLPQYLSIDDTKKLFNELKNFPYNIHQRFYAAIEGNIIYQGDGIEGIPAFQLPNTQSKISQSMAISNTCDMDIQNKRNIPMRILFSQIISLGKIEKSLLETNIPKDKISNYIESIRQQKVTNAFYLPKGSKIEESVVFFDYTNSFDIHFIDRETIKDKKLFSLSDYGFYILLLKLSIHFTRIQEKVNRN